MLPARLLSCRLLDGRLLPGFLDEADLPWLERLLSEHACVVGQSRHQVDAHLRAAMTAAPPHKLAMALRTLERLCATRVRAAVPPAIARAQLFAAAAASDAPMAQVTRAVAEAIGVSVEDLQASLFADLPGEQVLQPSREKLGPESLRLRANLALAQGLLARSTDVTVCLEGHARAIVRQAKLYGLLCVATADGPGVRLAISGPLSLFRRTTMYGRALAALVPCLSWCQRFRLQAEVVLRGESVQLELASGAPIFPGTMPRRFDSALEARFAEDFGRLAPDWLVVREPVPVQAGRELIFPDFALVHRTKPQHRWLVEIVGFWTREYLERKLRQLRALRESRFILCLDETRQCDTTDLPDGMRVVRFRKRVNAAVVHALVVGTATATGLVTERTHAA